MVRRQIAAAGLALRSERSKRVRRACCALRASDTLTRRLPAPGRIRELGDAVEAVERAVARQVEAGAEHIPEFCEPALDLIDRSLDELSAEVVEGLAEIPLTQLRASLPEHCRTQRREVEALLDLALEQPKRVPSLWQRLEYLITLLASSERDGRRTLTVDPTEVTPGMQRAAVSSDGLDAETAHEFKQAFEHAMRELAESDTIDAVIARMRRFKQERAEALLAPEMLRRVVEYNLAVGNRLATLIESERRSEPVPPPRLRPAYVIALVAAGSALCVWLVLALLRPAAS